MNNNLSPTFLIKSCVNSEELKTNFKIDFSRLALKDYHKLRTDIAINYAFYQTKYGEIIIASTDVGICYLHFVENKLEAIKALKNYLPDCNYEEVETKLHQIALLIIEENKWPEMLKIQVKASDFQYKVWRGLTKIDKGQITNYSELAKNIGIEGGARAVGSAIGSNEIALLIPCHRVVQKTGKLAGFRWGEDVKQRLLIAELLEK